MMKYAGTQEGKECDNIMYAAYLGGPPSETALAEYGAHVGTAYANHILTLQNEVYELNTLSVTDLSSDTANFAVNDINTAGSNGGNTLAAAACYLANWTVARRYRGGKPRSYFGGVSAADTSSLFDFSTATQTAWATGLANFLAAHTTTVGAGVTFSGLVCLSYYDKALNPIPPYTRTAPVAYPITAGELHLRICTQRRRLGKG
jgi:hypothetical protein